MEKTTDPACQKFPCRFPRLLRRHCYTMWSKPGTWRSDRRQTFVPRRRGAEPQIYFGQWETPEVHAAREGKQEGSRLAKDQGQGTFFAPPVPGKNIVQNGVPGFFQASTRENWNLARARWRRLGGRGSWHDKSGREHWHAVGHARKLEAKTRHRWSYSDRVGVSVASLRCPISRSRSRRAWNIASRSRTLLATLIRCHAPADCCDNTHK